VVRAELSRWRRNDRNGRQGAIMMEGWKREREKGRGERARERERRGGGERERIRENIEVLLVEIGTKKE